MNEHFMFYLKILLYIIVFYNFCKKGLAYSKNPEKKMRDKEAKNNQILYKSYIDYYIGKNINKINNQKLKEKLLRFYWTTNRVFYLIMILPMLPHLDNPFRCLCIGLCGSGLLLSFLAIRAKIPLHEKKGVLLFGVFAFAQFTLIKILKHENLLSDSLISDLSCIYPIFYIFVFYNFIKIKRLYFYYEALTVDEIKELEKGMKT